MSARENLAPAAPRPPEEEPLIDLDAVRDWASFVRHAIVRHQFLALVIFLAVAGAGASVPWALGHTWHVEATLLAQRNQVMPALGNPRRSIPSDADAPTRAAAEIVLRRANLVSLIRQTRLADSWTATRPPLLRVKDLVLDKVRGPLDDDAKLDALVGVLERRFAVRAGDGTVTIALDWHDPQVAHQLVESAQQNFLEARHVSEVSTIAEAISILEGHAAEVRESILTAISDLEKLQPRQGRSSSPAPRGVSPKEEERAQILVLLTAKRRAIADLEDFRRRRLADLQTQLAQQRASYQEVHPQIVDLKDSIAALGKESPQIESLRAEERQLIGEYERAGGRLGLEDVGERATLPAPPEAIVLVQRPAAAEPPEHEYARARLRFAVSKYESLLDRIDGARIELDTARAAFKYRYTVVRPSQVPRKPAKPRAALLIAGGILGGLFLAVFAAVARDVLSGRLHEPWQLQRLSRIPMLGKLEAP